MKYLTQKNQLHIKKKFKFNKKKIKYSPRLTKSNFGIVSSSFSLVSFKQIETLRRFILKRVKKKTFKYFRFFLSSTIFKKGSKARMGKGIGKFYKWYGYIKPGSLLFEFTLYNNNVDLIFKKFYYINTKFPFKIKLIFRNISY